MSDSDDSTTSLLEQERGGSCCGSGREVYDEAPIPDPDDRDTIFNYVGPGPWFSCQPSAIVPPRIAAEGCSGPKTPASTLGRMMNQAAEKRGDEPALKVERPCPPCGKDNKVPPALPDDEWTTWTYEEWLDDVRRLSKSFMRLGVVNFDAVNIWGFNSPEWFIGAVAAAYCGGKMAGIYPTDTADTAAYKVVHSGGAIVLVDDRAKADKLVKALGERRDAKRIKAIGGWSFDIKRGETLSVVGCGAVPFFGWEDLMGLGGTSDAQLDTRMNAVQPGQCAALIYTSGTTGEPKAVMISHDNIIFESSAVRESLKSCGMGRQGQERILSYLPLSHVAGCMVDIVTPVVSSAYGPGWVTAYFARPYDLKAGSIKDRLNAAKPTLFLGVPLVWEKIADKIRAIGAENTGAKKAVGNWAKSLGLKHARNCQLGGTGKYPCCYGLVDGLILKKIAAGLGLDQCKFGFTGAAPIRVDTLEYFGSLGLGINEVYGMSECTGACTWSTAEAHEWGSCGWQMPGVEVRSFIVDPVNINKKTEVPRSPDLNCTEEKYQGELCFRGRNIMMGYLAQPDLGQSHVAEINKKTAETIDSEGWLHSGDKGMITEAGMVKITGRYKELIIGEGGENIAPIPIEDVVKKTCDGVNEVMMIGDKRKYNVAIVTLKAVGANGEVPGTDQLDAGAKRVNPKVTTISAALDDPVWIKAVTDAITAANNNTKVCPNNAFKIQKFTILPLNFSEEKNELTPTKKLKRKVVETNYAELVEKIYKTDGTYIRH